MTPNRKQAPKRTILSVERVGTYGGVEYVHTLECGHVERRKRAAPTAQIACPSCVLADQHERRMRDQISIATELVDNWDNPWDPTGSNVASTEADALSMRAQLAAHFDVPPEAVDVVLVDEDGELTIQYAVVMLTATEVTQRLGRIGRPMKSQNH